MQIMSNSSGDSLKRRIGLLSLTALLVFGLVGGARAHDPEGELFFAFQWPDHNLPVIDGDLSEWDIVPPNPYTIFNDRMFANLGRPEDEGVDRGAMDASSLNLRSIVGFNASNDQLYFMAEVFDDFHNRDEEANCLWDDDEWEVRVNVAHNPFDEIRPTEFGGQEAPYNLAFILLAAPPIEDGAVGLGGYAFHIPWSDSDVVQIGSGYWEFAWDFDGEMFGESTYYYELRMRAYESGPEVVNSADDIAWKDVEEGQIFHINMNFSDFDVDPEPGQYDWWGVSPGPAHNNPTSDFVMAPLEDVHPTAVKATSWGLIKAAGVVQ